MYQYFENGFFPFIFPTLLSFVLWKRERERARMRVPLRWSTGFYSSLNNLAEGSSEIIEKQLLISAKKLPFPLEFYYKNLITGGTLFSLTIDAKSLFKKNVAKQLNFPWTQVPYKTSQKLQHYRMLEHPSISEINLSKGF